MSAGRAGRTTAAGSAWRLGHRPSLDALRGLAVLLVLGSHFRALPEEAGGVGVGLFFALSGYLITGLLLGELADTGTVRLRRFYVRRARRLLPALALLLVALGVVALAQGRFAAWWPRAVPVVAYAANWSILLGFGRPELGHTWSLSIEEQFYLVWPAALLWLASRRLLLEVALAVAIGSLALTAMESPSGVLPYYGSLERIKDLLLGAVVAIVAYRVGRDVVPWTPVALAAVVVLGLLCLGGHEWSSLLVPLPAAVVVAFVAGHPRWLDWRPLTGTGRISYGLYLYHLPLVGMAAWPVLVATSYALALASWFLVERRVIRRRGAERQLRGPAAAGAALTTAA